MDYQTIKHIHHLTVALTAMGFVARGVGMLVGAQWVKGKPARVLPHIVDTVLLLSGITLAVMLRLDPLAAPWLAAKLIGLLVYIGLGVVALRAGRSLRIRAAAWVAALLVLGWMVSVAITKNPLGWLGTLA